MSHRRATKPEIVFPDNLFEGVPLWFRGLIFTLVFAVLLIIAVGVILLFVWPFILAGLWQNIRGGMDSPWVRGGATVTLVAISVLLYVARTILRSFYGAAEILVGIAACWVGLGNSSASGLSASITVAGGVYIIVRGIDNLMQGRAELRSYIHERQA